MKHTFPVRVVWQAGILTLALLMGVLGACGSNSSSNSTGQWTGGASSQQVGGNYGAHSAPTPAPPAPTSSPSPRPAASTPTDGSGTSSATGPTDLEQQIAQSVFQAINTDRASAGLPALTWSSSLITGAYAHSLLMSTDDHLAHQLAGEPAIGTRISQDGVKWTWCGENIGETSDTSASGALNLHQMMMAEQPPNDGHRQNILSINFTLVGIAIVIDSSHQLWLTEDFAN
jgi:uncharacterized protein YkwD